MVMYTAYNRTVERSTTKVQSRKKLWKSSWPTATQRTLESGWTDTTFPHTWHHPQPPGQRLSPREFYQPLLHSDRPSAQGFGSSSTPHGKSVIPSARAREGPQEIAPMWLRRRKRVAHPYTTFYASTPASISRTPERYTYSRGTRRRPHTHTSALPSSCVQATPAPTHRPRTPNPLAAERPPHQTPYNRTRQGPRTRR